MLAALVRLVTVVLALVIGIVVMSVLLPLYDLTNAIG
jgi:general secretion pathway protein F